MAPASTPSTPARGHQPGAGHRAAGRRQWLAALPHGAQPHPGVQWSSPRTPTRTSSRSPRAEPAAGTTGMPPEMLSRVGRRAGGPRPGLRRWPGRPAARYTARTLGAARQQRRAHASSCDPARCRPATAPGQRAGGTGAAAQRPAHGRGGHDVGGGAGRRRGGRSARSGRRRRATARARGRARRAAAQDPTASHTLVLTAAALRRSRRRRPRSRRSGTTSRSTFARPLRRSAQPLAPWPAAGRPQPAGAVPLLGRARCRARRPRRPPTSAGELPAITSLLGHRWQAGRARSSPRCRWRSSASSRRPGATRCPRPRAPPADALVTAGRRDHLRGVRSSARPRALHAASSNSPLPITVENTLPYPVPVRRRVTTVERPARLHRQRHRHRSRSTPAQQAGRCSADDRSQRSGGSRSRPQLLHPDAPGARASPCRCRCTAPRSARSASSSRSSPASCWLLPCWCAPVRAAARRSRSPAPPARPAPAEPPAEVPEPSDVTDTSRARRRLEQPDPLRGRPAGRAADVHRGRPDGLDASCRTGTSPARDPARDGARRPTSASPAAGAAIARPARSTAPPDAAEPPEESQDGVGDGADRTSALAVQSADADAIDAEAGARTPERGDKGLMANSRSMAVASLASRRHRLPAQHPAAGRARHRRGGQRLQRRQQPAQHDLRAAARRRAVQRAHPAARARRGPRTRTAGSPTRSGCCRSPPPPWAR